jgi:hypothetical protein
MDNKKYSNIKWWKFKFRFFMGIENGKLLTKNDVLQYEVVVVGFKFHS